MVPRIVIQLAAFFVEKDKGMFAMFADNHHEDGHLAVWLPVVEGLESALIEEEPATYFKRSVAAGCTQRE